MNAACTTPVTAAFPTLRVCMGGLCVLLASTTYALDINQANEAELDSLKGMGPALTANVLQARAQAPFTSWDDVAQRVSGMGPRQLKRFAQQGLTVNGQALSP